MSGGVRNLRAMFENKEPDTSPPADRGRSPASTSGIASNSTSPRPLSKIRTSFVMVEKSGQMGLQVKRDPSRDSRSPTRRTSFSNDKEQRPGVGRSDSTVSSFSRKKSGAVIEDSIPEMVTPKTASEEQIDVRTKDLSAVETPKVEDNKAVEATKGPVETQLNGTSNRTQKSKATEKAPVSKTASRPTPISTAKAVVLPKVSPKKSPAAPKTPTTPRGRGRGVEQSSKVSEKKPEKKASRSSLAPAHSSKSTARPPSTATSNTSTTKARILTSPPQTGFVKPKPRSPTRPVKLPASLMAHTASSGSKTSSVAPPPPRSLSRATGTSPSTTVLQTTQSVVRSPSRASTSSTGKTSTLNRKPSNLNKTSNSGRPSLGPPPAILKKQSSRQSLAKSAPADDSFLNRMMRPTTSSASKTAAIVPVTPPKRTASAKRPAAREANHRTHEGPKASPAVPKPAPKSIAKVVASVSKHVKKEPGGKAGSLLPPSKAVEESPKETIEIVHETVKTAKSPSAEESRPTKPADTAEQLVVLGDSPDTPPIEDSVAEELKSEDCNTAVLEAAEEEALDAPSPIAEESKDTEEPETIPGPLRQILSPVIESPAQVHDPETAEKLPSVKASKSTGPTNNIAAPSTEEISNSPEIPDVESPEKLENVEIEESEVREAEITPEIAKAEPVKEHQAEVAPIELPEAVIVNGNEGNVAQPEKVEDPEDVRAREEIARLNAELIKSSDETF